MLRMIALRIDSFTAIFPSIGYELTEQQTNIQSVLCNYFPQLELKCVRSGKYAKVTCFIIKQGCKQTA